MENITDDAPECYTNLIKNKFVILLVVCFRNKNNKVLNQTEEKKIELLELKSLDLNLLKTSFGIQSQIYLGLFFCNN